MTRLSRWVLCGGLALAGSGCAEGYYGPVGAAGGGGGYGYGNSTYGYAAPAYGYAAPAYRYGAPAYGYAPAPRYGAPRVYGYAQQRSYDYARPRAQAYVAPAAPGFGPRGQGRGWNPPRQGNQQPTVGGREYSRRYLQQRPGGGPEVGTGN